MTSTRLGLEPSRAHLLGFPGDFSFLLSKTMARLFMPLPPSPSHCHICHLPASVLLPSPSSRDNVGTDWDTRKRVPLFLYIASIPSYGYVGSGSPSSYSAIHFSMPWWADFRHSRSLALKVPGLPLWKGDKQRCKGEHLVRFSNQTRTPVKWSGYSCPILEGLPRGQTSCCPHYTKPHTSCEFLTAHGYSFSSPRVVVMTFTIPSLHAISRTDEQMKFCFLTLRTVLHLFNLYISRA